MAKICERPTIKLNLTFTVDEEEAAALQDLAGYGVDQFIKAFYENLGRAYMEKHEAGLRRFLSTICNDVGPSLGRLEAARRVFNGEEKS